MHLAHDKRIRVAALFFAAYFAAVHDVKIRQAPTDPLTGRWRIEMHLDSSVLLQRPLSRDLTGILALREKAPADTQWYLANSITTHTGLAQISLEPFGFGPKIWEQPELGPV